MKGSKKGKGYRIRGSLASRILLISLLFLVFPLLALVGLLYIEDAKIKSDNNYFILKVMMDQKEDFVTEMVDHEQVFMSGISYLLREIPEAEKNLPELAKREEVSAFIHVEENKEGRFFSSMASDPSFLNKEYTDVIDQARVGTVFYLDPDSSLFYLTHIERERTRAWIIAFTLTSILNNFPIENDVITPSSTFLVAQSGKIISSTDDAFEGKQLKIPIGNSITIDETDYVTDFRKIANANFGLMIAAPEEANFVNIPHFVIKVIVGLSIIAVLGGGGAFFLTKKLGHPLQSLIGVMDQVGSGDLSRRFEKESMGFEINALGEIFNETVDALNQNMEAVQKERIEKETYEKELKIGEEVQHSIIPERLPAFPGLKMAARFIAAKEVGGDFYDLIPKERLMISIADSAGKGVSACLYSLSLRSMLRSFSELHSDLPTILKKTNNLFCQDTGNTGEFVTAFVAFFDPKTKVLEYSNCGHFPALRIKKNGEWDHLTTHGMALGVTLFEEVATAKITLESGDLVVFFTDGIVEAHNEAMELFGEERLLHHLQEQKGKSPQEIVDAMIEIVAFFAEGSPQFDDLTLIVVKVV